MGKEAVANIKKDQLKELRDLYRDWLYSKYSVTLKSYDMARGWRSDHGKSNRHEHYAKLKTMVEDWQTGDEGSNTPAQLAEVDEVVNKLKKTCESFVYKKFKK